MIPPELQQFFTVERLTEFQSLIVRIFEIFSECKKIDMDTITIANDKTQSQFIWFANSDAYLRHLEQNYTANFGKHIKPSNN